jgi:mediator of RNA polymerase II transcription subunit 6
MSNNSVLNRQAMANPSLFSMIWNRKEFEARLAQIAGIEYRVVDGPERSTPEQVNPVWVIRKQNREKRANQPDRVTVEATYFVMGEFIFQAPSLEDVLRVRLVSIG